MISAGAAEPQVRIDAIGPSVDFRSTSIRNAALDIYADVQSGSTANITTLSIDVNLIEQLNIRFSEKQVRGIDLNFLEYHLGNRISNSTPITPTGMDRDYLFDKVFSADVSGDIGETVFVHLLSSHFALNLNNVGHLRPEKLKKRLTPDFLIWQSSHSLASFLQDPHYRLPIYAEVKSSTGSINAKRIESALEQLKTVMPARSNGLLFLLQKANSSYSGFLVGVNA